VTGESTTATGIGTERVGRASGSTPFVRASLLVIDVDA